MRTSGVRWGVLCAALVAGCSNESGEAQPGALDVAYRFEGPRIVRTVEEKLYTLTAMQSRWIGAELDDIDLYLELASGPDAIEVGGLLTTRAGERIRDLALLSPQVVARRHHKPQPGEPQEGKAAGSGGAPGASPQGE